MNPVERMMAQVGPIIELEGTLTIPGRRVIPITIIGRHPVLLASRVEGTVGFIPLAISLEDNRELSGLISIQGEVSREWSGDNEPSVGNGSGH